MCGEKQVPRETSKLAVQVQSECRLLRNEGLLLGSGLGPYVVRNLASLTVIVPEATVRGGIPCPLWITVTVYDPWETFLAERPAATG